MYLAFIQMSFCLESFSGLFTDYEKMSLLGSQNANKHAINCTSPIIKVFRSIVRDAVLDYFILIIASTQINIGSHNLVHVLTASLTSFVGSSNLEILATPLSLTIVISQKSSIMNLTNCSYPKCLFVVFMATYCLDFKSS